MKRVLVYALSTIIIFLLNLALAQEESHSEKWVQGHLAVLSKGSISVDDTEYKIGPLVNIADSHGNTLDTRALRNAEIVKALVIDGNVKEIIVILFRE